MFTRGRGRYLEIVKHDVFHEANVMRSHLQVVDRVKHYFHCLVCNPVGCGGQRGLRWDDLPESTDQETQT